MNKRHETLIEKLLARTREGTVRWEPTLRPSQYLYVFSTGQAVVIDEDVDEDEDQEVVRLRVKNDAGVEIDSISAPKGTTVPLCELYEQARRQAMKTDETLDRLIEQL